MKSPEASSGVPAATATPPPKSRVLDQGISIVTMEDASRFIESTIRSQGREYVCVCSVNMVMRARKDEALHRAMEGAGLVVADGFPVARAVRRRHPGLVEQVRGIDLFHRVSEVAARRGFRFYLYGGAPDVPEALERALRARYPGLKVVGSESPPYRPLTPEENAEAVRRINAARPDIVWVGLGCPKQEKWMLEHRKRLDAPVLIGVGAAFDFASGRKREAPRWIQRVRLEWFWRVMHEPVRLWRRPLLEAPAFFALSMRESLRPRRDDLNRKP